MTAQTPKHYGILAIALATNLGVLSGIALASLGFKLPKPPKGG